MDKKRETKVIPEKCAKGEMADKYIKNKNKIEGTATEALRKVIITKPHGSEKK